MAWPWDRLIMKAKIKKFAESSGDMIGSLVTNATTDHIGRGALDKRADFIEPNQDPKFDIDPSLAVKPDEQEGVLPKGDPMGAEQVVGDIKEDAGAPSAISTSGSISALSTPTIPKKDLEEAHYSYIDNVQVPGEVQSNPTGSRMLGNTGETLEEENYGDLGSNGDGGRLGAMHSLNQQAFDNFNSDTSQNLQSYDQTNQDTGPSQTYTNADNALVGVSDGEDPTLLSTTNDIGGKTGLNNANQQTLINKDKFAAAKSDSLQATDTQAHENEEKKLESLILSKFPNHDSRHLAVFESYYDHKHGKKKIQSKKYNSSFVLKHSDYQNYFLEYLEYFSTEGSRIILERYEDQNKVDKYQFINSNSGESLPRTLKEENMEEFDLGKLDTEDEVKDDIEDEVESGEGDELLDILKKVADGALSPDEAIEDVKAAMDKEDEKGSADLDLDADEPAEDSPEDEEELEESGMPELATEECATTHAQAVTESKAKAAKPSAKKPEVKKTAPKAVAKKPVPKAAPKKGLKESSKPFASNFYYIYSNGRVVDFGQATRITESQITLANGKSYNLASVTLAPMRGW